MNFAYSISYKFVDKGLFEIVGPTGLSNVILKVGLGLNNLQTGYIYHYTSVILIFSTVFLCLNKLFLVFNFFLDYRLFIIVFFFSFFITNNIVNNKKLFGILIQKTCTSIRKKNRKKCHSRE